MAKTDKKPENTTTQVDKKEGLIKKATSGAFGLLRAGAGKLFKTAGKAIVIAGGVFVGERLIESTYEKITGNEIKWNFQHDKGESVGLKLEHVDNSNIYVGSSSTRGHEFDDITDSSGSADMQSDVMS